MSAFSETLMDHFQSPRNHVVLPDADYVGTAGLPGRGRFIVLYFILEDDRVKQTGFQCHGCGVTIAAASVLTELLQGKSIPDCLAIRQEDVIRALDGVPVHKRDAPAMAVQAIQNAFQEKPRHGPH